MSRKDIGEEVLRCLIVTVACPLGAKVPRLADDAKKPSQIADGIEIRRKTPPIGIGRRDLPPEFVHQYVIELTKDSAIPAAPSILSKYICDRLRGRPVSLEIHGLGVDPDDEQIRRTFIKRLEKRRTLIVPHSREKNVENSNSSVSPIKHFHITSQKLLSG